MKIQKAKEHLLKAKSITVSGHLEGFFITTDDFAATLHLLREAEKNG